MKWGIKNKVIVLITAVLLMSVGVLSIVISNKVQLQTRSLHYQILEETAYRYGKSVENVLAKIMEDAKLMEIAFVQMMKSGTHRSVLDSMLIRTAKNDDQLLGTWMLWEPNAYDRQDKRYVNTEGHGSTGRVNSYWHWEGDSLINEPNIDWESSTWYNVPRERMKGTLLDPYWYTVSGEPTLLLSAIQPIIFEDEFLGVVGVDIELNNLQNFVNKLKVEDVGYTALLANDGTYVAYPQQEKIGKKISSEENEKELYEHLKNGKYYSKVIQNDKILGEEGHLISIPIKVLNTETPWAFVVVIPTSKIIAESKVIRNWILLLGGIFGCLTVLLLAILVSRQIAPIVSLTNRLTEIVTDDRTEIPLLELKKQTGEVGQLVKAYNELASRLHINKVKLLGLNEELEDRINKRTLQLESALKDLERFSYSISHDLRAPLRHINGFSKLLNGVIESDQEKAKYYSDKVIEASDKMRHMIDDLLKFSRLGRRALVLEEVDLNKLIDQVIKSFETEIEGRIIIWEVETLPTILADFSLMEMVFQNILSNAIKYTSKCEEAKIHIGVKGESEDVIFVKDNGVGFDMRYIDKLFGVFQRLHREEDFSGVGIGLANVKQIVTKHEGEIWAEAEVNEGATFYLKLNCKE
ncbi:GHKL domain-containing protein [Prolixibacteraceae bacterium JC049]|nr:GHKL domain-containing protein [Prolixibacteraceae bacterium JC049]